MNNKVKAMHGAEIIQMPIHTPKITGLAVNTSNDRDGQPLSMRLDSETGKASIVVNEDRFIDQVFRGLEIKAGKYKGRTISEELISEVIDIGKALLTKEDLFEDGVAGQYDDFQKNIAARIVSPVEEKRRELKKPINEIGKIFQGMPACVLGELLEIQGEVKARNKAYKVEKERRDREAAQADAAWRAETTENLVRISALVGLLTGSSSEKIRKALDELEEDNFEPHEDFAGQYADAVAGTVTTLATMLETAVQTEEEAKADAEKEAKRQAARDAELEKLKAEKAEKELKDKAVKEASACMLKISEIYMENSDKSATCISNALTEARELIDGCAGNEHFDSKMAESFFKKLDDALGVQVKKEDEAAEAEAKAKADREKAEAARVKQERISRAEENDRLLDTAGYLYDENADYYCKDGRCIFSSEDVMNVDSEFVKSEIKKTDRLILEEKARAEAEAKAVAEKKAAEEKARKDAEANRAAAEKEMASAVFALNDHESIVAAIISGDIPYVRFDAAFTADK